MKNRQMLQLFCFFSLLSAGALLSPPIRTAISEEKLPVYRLEDCLRTASERNARILQARRDIGIADGQKLQALSGYVPQLSAEAGYTYLDNIDTYETDEGELPLNLHDNYEVSLLLEQNLYQGGEILAGIKAAGYYQDYTDSGLKEVINDVSFEIKRLFYLLLLQKNIVSVRADTLRHMEDYLKITEQKYEQGTASEFDLITARVRVANSRPPLIKAENRVDILKTSLAREMGIDLPEFTISGELTYLPFHSNLPDLSRIGREHRPLLRQVDLEEKILEQLYNASYAGYQPRLSVFASYLGNRPQSGLPPDDKFEFEWQAGATLSWNLFDGLMTPGKVKEAEEQYEKARVITADTVRSVLLEIKQSFLDLEAARKSLLAQRETVGQAERAYRIARVRWENGISTSLELTDAELNLSEARVMYLDSLAAWKISRARVERAVGVNLDARGKILIEDENGRGESTIDSKET